MKRLLSIAVLLTLITTGQAPAQLSMSCPHGDLDNICVIFDYPEGCCINCLQPYVLGEVTAYVVLQNCTIPAGVFGFEFCLCNDDGSSFEPPPDVFVQSYDIPANGINALAVPCFGVGYAIPVPNGGFCTVLMSMDLVVISQDCFCFGVSPLFGPPQSPPPSIPGEMVYAAGDDPGTLLPMDPCTGLDHDACEMACINCAFCPPGPPIEAQDRTWGAIKSLYR